MSAALSKYQERASRYTLNTDDNSLIRYSGSERWPWEEKTEIQNISLSGLSFVAPNDLSPKIGEIIKIQFSVPGSQQMACYAVVIRIDSSNEYDNLIAVHFYKLDRAQRINLLQGLNQKFSIQQKNQTRHLNNLEKFIAFVGFAATLFCWFTLMKNYFLK